MKEAYLYAKIGGTKLQMRREIKKTADGSHTLFVPEQAVFKKQGKWFVYTVNNGKAALREIEVGLRNDDQAEILSGLNEGEIAITELINQLQDGVPTTPILPE